MTNITLEEGLFQFKMTVDGHTNYEAHGKDILCASISVLTQSFIMFCEAQEENGRATIEQIFYDDGYLVFWVNGDVTDGFRMMKLGLEAIAKQYPEYISLVGGEK